MEPSRTPPKKIRHEYPLAASPDVLRSHEKDSYLTQSLSVQASSILQSLFGVRFAHRYSNSINHFSELLYLSLTTLLGNRTLGEEYCDVIQVEDDTLRLASLTRRVGYVASVVFAPWFLAKNLPTLRRKLRAKLERDIQRAIVKQDQEQEQEQEQRSGQRPTKLRIQEYILEHLDAITSLTPVHALSLAAFYFTGSYYHISKRLFGLRYIFTRRIQPSEERVGYEVLGVLLVLQLLVQSTLHVHQTILNATPPQTTNNNNNKNQLISPETKLTTNTKTSTSQLLSHTIRTPILPHPRYDLSITTTTSQSSPSPPSSSTRSPANPLDWIPKTNPASSKCTLCLDPLRDPSVTSCGHVFCWTCIQDWLDEKAECPLCRQRNLKSKVLPLRS